MAVASKAVQAIGSYEGRKILMRAERKGPAAATAEPLGKHLYFKVPRKPNLS